MVDGRVGLQLRPLSCPTAIARLLMDESVSGQILNMFNTGIWPTLQRVCRRLWRVGRRLPNALTHTTSVEELAPELALESADYSFESAYYSSESADYSSESADYSSESADYSSESADYSSESADYSSESADYSSESADYSSESADYSSESADYSSESADYSSESADYSSESADYNAETPKTGVWVQDFIGFSEWGDGGLFI